METNLATFRSEVRIQEEVVDLIASSVDAPFMYHSGKTHYGFRYAKPGPKHFCLLKAARAVSGLNATISLIEDGYSQETAVIIRTIVECTSHIEFILSGYDGTKLDKQQRNYVDQYFKDYRRDSSSDFLRPRVRQGDVHEVVGSLLDEQVKKSPSRSAFEDIEGSKLMSNIYLTYSNYVHSRYPEVMDMFGGNPPHFHMRGMSGTPKDDENIAIVESTIETVSNSLRYIVLKFNLRQEMLRRPHLCQWYKVDSSTVT